MMSARRLARSSSGSRSASSSTWMLARRLAIGVRSSWLASATRWRCASTELLERVERRVEAARQARELVLALDLEPLREVGVGGQRLGAAGEARDGRERRARDDAPSTAASRMPTPPDGEHDEQQLAQRVVDLRQRPRDLHGAAIAEPDGEHAQVHAAAPWRR